MRLILMILYKPTKALRIQWKEKMVNSTDEVLELFSHQLSGEKTKRFQALIIKISFFRVYLWIY